ncbi:MAG: histidine kinase [Alphaproteobacteria bacterium]|nr:histidine kinase [Alphaproteobacteria bacterium]
MPWGRDGDEMGTRWNRVKHDIRGRNKENSGLLASDENEPTSQRARVDILEDERVPMFRLLRFYGIASAAAFIVISVFVVVLDRYHEFESLIEAVERQDVGLAHSFANTVWPSYSSYVMTVAGSTDETLRERSETRELHNAVVTLTAGLPILRIKVYDRKGRTIYSSERSQIGAIKKNHASFLAAANDGLPQSMYAHNHEFASLTGPVAHRDMVESYLPIWGHDGGIEGVLEIYTDITADMLLLDHGTLELTMIVAVVFGLLYAILFLIVRRANIVVERQYGNLVQSRANLNEKNTVLLREISERERLTLDLKSSEHRLRQLSDRLINAQEEERTRISRELHDGLGQGLTEIRIRVERAIDQLWTRSRNDVQEYLQIVAGAITTNMEEVRRISMGMRPSILDDLGIVATLKWACRSFRDNHPEVAVLESFCIAEQDLSDSVKTSIYRTFQEGLTNIVRHSQANRVRISLKKRGTRVLFTISDNGRGFIKSRAETSYSGRPGLGLCSLRERAVNSGGIFRLRSIPGVGTTIRVSWSVEPRDVEFTGPADLGLPQTPSEKMRYEGLIFS